MASKAVCHPNDIHEHPFFCNPKIRDYHRLEATRVRRLGLDPRYARQYDVTRNDPPAPIQYEGLKKCRQSTILPQSWDNFYHIRQKFTKTNVIMPFSSLYKNISGARFSWDTDNRRKKSKLPSGFLVPKWRPLANYDHYC